MAHPILAPLAKFAAISIAASQFANTPKPAVTFKAISVSGAATLLPTAGKKATVLVFVAHDCPVCNIYAPEIIRISREYRLKGAACYIVYAEKDLTATQATAHAKAYGLTGCGLLRDPNYALAHRARATITPEAVVLTPQGGIAYRGRIDDRYVTFGMARARVTHHDLRDALDSVLSGKPAEASTGKAVGCAIP